jgi:hypothetical protein
MFSQGQLVFAGFFYCICYRNDLCLPKDVKLHNLFYKGSYKVLIPFVVFIGLLFVIKVYFLKDSFSFKQTKGSGLCL